MLKDINNPISWENALKLAHHTKSDFDDSIAEEYVSKEKGE